MSFPITKFLILVLKAIWLDPYHTEDTCVVHFRSWLQQWPPCQYLQLTAPLMQLSRQCSAPRSLCVGLTMGLQKNSALLWFRGARSVRSHWIIRHRENIKFWWPQDEPAKQCMQLHKGILHYYTSLQWKKNKLQYRVSIHMQDGLFGMTLSSW